jgi:hypothetical protein
MKLSIALAFVVATSLVSTPVVAQAAAAEQARLGADVEGENLRGGFIIPLIALIAIILGLCAATDVCGGDDDDLPHSP